MKEIFFKFLYSFCSRGDAKGIHNILTKFKFPSYQIQIFTSKNSTAVCSSKIAHTIVPPKTQTFQLIIKFPLLPRAGSTALIAKNSNPRIHKKLKSHFNFYHLLYKGTNWLWTIYHCKTAILTKQTFLKIKFLKRQRKNS